jgi:hypothetical protein
MRRHRGGDLAYLATLPPEQAKARRFVHEAVASEIEIARMVSASRRERRSKLHPKVKPIKTIVRVKFQNGQG